MSRLETLAARVEAELGDKLSRAPSVAGELTYVVAAPDLLSVAAKLRDAPGIELEMLMDVCGVDYLTYGEDEWRTRESTSSGYSRGVNRGLAGPEPDAREPGLHDPEPEPVAKQRYAVVYHLLSIKNNVRLRLKTFCPDDEHPMVDSVVDIWNSANWFEREAFDLFGILFRGHPDLRRLLTDYGFVGHPFRKDFPLVGNVEVRYDPERGRVVYQPVTIEPRTLVPKVIRGDARYEHALKSEASFREAGEDA